MGYKTSNKKSKNIELRRSIYNSLDSKEKRHKHYIPPKAIGNTAKKHGLSIRYAETIRVNKKGFKDNGVKQIFVLKDKKGITHAEVALNKKTNKVDWWLVK